MYRQRIPELESARTYGILGIILQFIGTAGDIFLHGLGFIITVIGLILLLFGLKSISNYYGDKKPYRYMLYSMISGIVLGVISAISIIIFLIPVATSIISTKRPPSLPVSGMALIFLAFSLIILAVLISIIFEYIAYNSVFELTGIREFHTGALLLLLGIILTVILIGIILILVGIILIIIGFNNLPEYAKPVVVNQDVNQDHNEGII
jgi:uncharacterized membrane protein